MSCASCDRGDDVPRQWLEGAFLEKDVTEHRHHGTLLKCAACLVEALPEHEGQETKKCSDCKRQIPVRGPPEGFSPVLLRAYLAG